MKETIEFIEWLGDVAAQSVTSFADGAQASDASQFFDEGLAAPTGIGGFFKNAKTEAGQATVIEIDAAWKRQEQKIVNAGANELAAATMVNGLKTTHLGFAWAVQSAQDASKVSIQAA